MDDTDVHGAQNGIDRDSVCAIPSGFSEDHAAERGLHPVDVLEAIYTRRAVRSYDDRPLDRETILALLEAAVQAPSAINRQPWAFVVIQDRALLERYSERAKALIQASGGLDGLDAPIRAMLENPEYSIFYNAGTLIVVCAKPGGEGHGDWDCCLAAQNLMLAAQGMGLGTCPVGFAWSLLELPEIKQELLIPDDVRPVLPLIVGYPAPPASPAPPRRAPQILSWR